MISLDRGTQIRGGAVKNVSFKILIDLFIQALCPMKIKIGTRDTKETFIKKQVDLNTTLP